jgi:hypothetical protein
MASTTATATAQTGVLGAAPGGGDAPLPPTPTNPKTYAEYYASQMHLEPDLGTTMNVFTTADAVVKTSLGPGARENESHLVNDRHHLDSAGFQRLF